jgi:hypothetical protein
VKYSIDDEFHRLLGRAFDLDYEYVDNDYNATTILAANFQGTLHALPNLKQLIKNFWPKFVWIMEPDNQIKNLTYYVKVKALDFHQSQLWIREDCYRGRNISRIPYGIQVDDLNFRYIPPKAKKKCKFEENEIGDFNFRTHKWINLHLKCEKRFGIPGGLGIQTKYENTVSFIDFPTDHDALYCKLDRPIKQEREVDWIKLEYELTKADENPVTNIYKNKLPKNKEFKEQRLNSSIINPITKHLDLKDWLELYGHNIMKCANSNYKVKLSLGDPRNIISKAKDINGISIQKFIKMAKNYNAAQRQIMVNKLCKMRFDTRVVCLKKKGKPPDKVKNLRPIQISPIQFKMAEQSRTHLKSWLEKRTDPRFYAFIPGKDIFGLLRKIMNKFA